MLKRKTFEKLESEFLSDYAMKSKDSRGRIHPEAEHLCRSAFHRDRDRIIHSLAFRRLEYKTQVFVNYEGDYYRTRLTHTLEVAQIAKAIARALRLSEDLVEAIALAHDLGHTPFGHAGEEALRKLMEADGGFEHNRHGLRVVDYLEERYPKFKGLNLSWEVREGIAMHKTAYDKAELPKEFRKFPHPSLEAQVVDVADEIAYNNHDLDDGLTSQFLKFNQLDEVELWKLAKDEITKSYPKMKDEIKKYQIIKFLINLQVQDVIEHTEQLLKKHNIHSPDQARSFKKKLVCFSSTVAKKCTKLRVFLNENLYQHYRVARMSNKAKKYIEELFGSLSDNCGKQLPPTSFARIKKEGIHRVV